MVSKLVKLTNLGKAEQSTYTERTEQSVESRTKRKTEEPTEIIRKWQNNPGKALNIVLKKDWTLECSNYLQEKIDIQQSTYLRGKNLKTSKRQAENSSKGPKILLTGPIDQHEVNLRKDLATYRKTKQLTESTN